ncbi:MAG: glycoside hydrolase family 31 protein [Eubacteriales bacterium]|nr:glycoside hydrolase family 31 protein [Eubacteriales bacterium]
MIKKFVFNNPFKTYATVLDIESCTDTLPYFEYSKRKFTYKMSDTTCVYGLGEAVRGINKRGWIYEGYCSDDPSHTEDKRSLYGAHNFLIIDDKQNDGNLFGVFFDYPARITFDIGYSNPSILEVSIEKDDIAVYIIEGNTKREIVRNFRKLIGMSYVAPKWAFGYMQSRWSYFTKDDVIRIADDYEESDIPLDAIFLDIDYMERFKDFTIHDERFPDFEQFVDYMKRRGIRLVPIIDAAVKVEDDYDVYEEGRKNGYFCKDKDGNDYVVGVWPGRAVFPDFLNKDAGKWFSDKYKILTDMGIEGFWNDMNEPAIFYSDKGLDKAFSQIEKYREISLDANTFFDCRDVFPRLSNSQDDYNSFYHNVDGKQIKHNDVHNLYGYFMTKTAQEGFMRNNPDKRTLLFSRASYIGAHRYGGIWTGDNHSWWSHILLCLKQMPSLNMCGFVYSGCDLGGFNGNCTRDLLLRYLSLGIFTPLMRNHSACGTKDQECFAYSDVKDFKNIIDFRYRLIPYIYSEYMKAVLNDDMYIRPLSFDYENDEMAKNIEDQVMVGQSIMIAPVYTQNADGRYVYIPENMTQVRLNADSTITQTKIEKGHHYVNVPLNEIVFFIKENHCIPLCDSAKNVDSIDYSTIKLIGDADTYELYTDDGITTQYSLDNIKTISK